MILPERNKSQVYPLDLKFFPEQQEKIVSKIVMIVNVCQPRSQQPESSLKSSHMIEIGNIGAIPAEHLWTERTAIDIKIYAVRKDKPAVTECWPLW